MFITDAEAIVCGLTHGHLFVISPFWSGTIKGWKSLRDRESAIHVVDNSYSVVTALVDWILWWLCNH